MPSNARPTKASNAHQGRQQSRIQSPTPPRIHASGRNPFLPQCFLIVFLLFLLSYAASEKDVPLFLLCGGNGWVGIV